MRLEFSRSRIIGQSHLASVAVLAIGKLRGGAEHAFGRPVRQIRFDAKLRADRHPLQVSAPLHEPKVLAANEIKGEKAQRAIVKLVKKRLGSPAVHMAASNHRIHLYFNARNPGLLQGKHIFAPRVYEWSHRAVFEVQRLPIKAGNHLGLMRRATGLPMSGTLPEIELLLMAFGACFRAQEVLNLRLASRDFMRLGK